MATDFDNLQDEIKRRQFCVGWRQEGSHHKIYDDTLFDSWHEANRIAVGSCQPGYIPFVEAITETKICPRCNGSGTRDLVDYGIDTCPTCNGKGKIRKS
jgi:RecJ-like exonuclease